MNVLLIQPPVRDFYFTAKRSIPYGLISIASVLRKGGHTVSLLDALSTSKSKSIPLPSEMAYLKPYYGRKDISPFALFHQYRYYGYSQEYLGKRIRESGADIVGIASLFTAYSSEANEIARLVKKELPNAVVVVGGHHPTALPEPALSEPSVDYAIRGEGEAVFPELLDALAEKRPPDGIAGLAYRKKDGTIETGDPVWMTHPDDYPLPGFDLVNHRFYSRKNGTSMVITASRGCPMRCTYCCVASPSSPFRRRCVDAVFEEIQNGVETHGVRFIDFEDENLTFNRKWFLDLMEKIRNRFSGIGIELRAMNGLYPPSLDEEMIEIMAETGFKEVNLSLCTTSREQLRRFNRPDVRTAFEKLVPFIRKNGMSAVCYVIAGAPGQDPVSTVADLIYLYRHNVLGGVSVFYPAPGSVEYDRAKSAGLLPHSTDLLRSSVIPVSDTTSRTDSVTLLRLGRIVNFMKSLRDQGGDVQPAELDRSSLSPDSDRTEAGKRLLSAFLYDGKIRGMEPDGTIYEHIITDELTRLFLQGISE